MYYLCRYSRPGDGEFEDYQRIGCKVAAFVPKGKDPGQFHPSLFFSERERPAMSQSSMFSCVAAEEALGDAEWTSRGMNERELSRTGISLGTAGFDGTDCMRQIEVFKENPLDLYPQTVLRFIGSMVAGLVGIRSGFRGPLSSLSTACATGTQSVMEGCRLIQEDRADVMICGSAESLATPLSLALFSVSGAVCTKYSDSPESASRPFDADRAGLVMGEGAGVLILEELEHALRRGAPRIYGEIVGCGMSSDAHHVTTPRPDVSGSLSAMTAALEGHNLEDVWMVDAHATSTKKGDIAEAKALARLLEPLAGNLAKLGSISDLRIQYYSLLRNRATPRRGRQGTDRSPHGRSRSRRVRPRVALHEEQPASGHRKPHHNGRGRSRLQLKVYCSNRIS